MTGLLRTTLHTRADHLTAWDVDLDTIVRTGDRRVRRRRTVLAGGVAGVLAVVGGVAALADRHPGTSPQPADGSAKPLTYAVGHVIHSGADIIDVGKKVVSFVPTHWGFVFSTPDRRLYQERGGQVQPVTTFDGHPSQLSDTSPLVVSDDGLVTAWWDGARIQTWPGYRDAMVDAFDKTNSFNAGRSWPSQDPPRIEAVSDGHLWWWDGRDHWIGEVRPMKTTAGWKDANPPGSGTVVDAAGDRVLVHTADGMAVTTANLLPSSGQQGSWKPGGDLAGLGTQVAGVSTGDLAPDGKHWFAQGTHELTVFDSASGRRENLGHPGFAFAEPYQWRDDDTIAAYALGTADGQTVSLLTCQVSTGTCTVTAPQIGEIGNVVLPDGRQLGG
jgi:hypothetical protein